MHHCDLIGDRGKERCGMYDPNCQYICTREPDHDGDHVACGSIERHHELNRWSADE